MESINCPICNGVLVPDAIVAPTLDKYNGELFVYACCNECGILVLQNPPRHKGEVDYSADGYYQIKKERYYCLVDKIRLLYTAHLISITKSSTDNNSLHGKTILDIGCGKGYFLESAKECGSKIRGIEPTQRSYDVAKYKLGDVVENVVMSGDLFPEKSFDIVTMWHVFEHLSDPILILKACRQVLKDRGSLIVAVPNYKGLISKIGQSVWFNLDPPRHLIHYSPESLCALMTKNGFEVKKINYYYPSLTYLSALQTLLNKLPITNNFLFNYLKRNAAGFPPTNVLYRKDLVLTITFGILFSPVVFVFVPIISLMKASDCFTITIRKR